MTLRTRLLQLERAMPAPACPTCRDWQGDVLAALSGDDDPWRRDDGRRLCPDCERRPPITTPWATLIGSDIGEVIE